MTSLQFSVKPRLWVCAGALAALFAVYASAQEPVVVQPGAPGQPTKTLPPNTRPTLPWVSQKDIEFMQGMIMHHQQAVEMVALMDGRVESKELHLLGSRISHSQTEEIGFMKRWLAARGQPAEMKSQMPDGMAGMSMPGMNTPTAKKAEPMLMPGMLTPKQMEALRNAKGKEFDKLFLQGMIQHHTGALTMVRELYQNPGTGQDGELFGFTTDVDTGQRAEIRVMQGMLDKLQ